eukprot:5748144-Prymnesium_polylepis.1
MAGASAAANDTYARVAEAAGTAVEHAVQLKEAAGKTVEASARLATACTSAAGTAYGAGGRPCQNSRAARTSSHRRARDVDCRSAAP